MTLDAADKKILRLLQSNGRMTNQELAANCNISPSACHERFKRLRDEGYILGFSAVLDPEKLGKAFVVFVQIWLQSNAGEASDEFAEAASRLPEVREAYQMMGGYDYLLKIQVASMSEYKTFLGKTLAQIGNVKEIRSIPVMDMPKQSSQLPI
jgi:Lrp/AsnC family transcriptional regulator, leucine-responsive regulatory protein